MATTGKKGKKAKWIPAAITDILAEPTTIPTTQNWADSVDDEGETFSFTSRQRAAVVLPSASRAARGGLAVDDDSIPRRPPYVAYISNLPYDVDESAISELFEGLKIQNLRLPREGDRLKGFGYVDFEDRESLIDAMNIPDLTISGRRIRIDVSTQENDRRMGNNRGGRTDRERDYDPERTVGDWRSGPRSESEPQRNRPPDRMRERERDSSPGEGRASVGAGAWRDGERPGAEPARAPYGGRDSYGRDRFEDRDRFPREGGPDRDRGYGRDGFREADRGYGRDGFRSGGDRFRDSDRGGSRGFGERRGFGDRDRDPPRDEPQRPRERPKLNLLPRTVPRDEPAAEPAREADADARPAPKPLPAEKVFGAAKPVDTAAKEREIEERLKRQEEEARRGADGKAWGRRNDGSADRRGPRRNDEPRTGNRESRSYRDSRDRRDISKENRDNRDYSRESRDSRNNRGTSDDNQDSRNYSRDRYDSRDRHDSRDRRNSQERRGSRDRYDSREESNSKDTAESKEHKETKDADGGQEEGQRGGRSAERRDNHKRKESDEEKPMPKFKEQEPPNFAGSNKFSCLEDTDAATLD